MDTKYIHGVIQIDYIHILHYNIYIIEIYLYRKKIMKWDGSRTELQDDCFSEILGKDEQLLVEQNFWYSCSIYGQILTGELIQLQALSAY